MVGRWEERFWDRVEGLVGRGFAHRNGGSRGSAGGRSCWGSSNLDSGGGGYVSVGWKGVVRFDLRVASARTEELFRGETHVAVELVVDGWLGDESGSIEEWD